MNYIPKSRTIPTWVETLALFHILKEAQDSLWSCFCSVQCWGHSELSREEWGWGAKRNCSY